MKMAGSLSLIGRNEQALKVMLMSQLFISHLMRHKPIGIWKDKRLPLRDEVDKLCHPRYNEQ